MAIQSKAPGDGPATGTPKTPAPDILSRQSHTEVYAGPQFGGKTYDNPGERTVSPLAAELERVSDVDGTLAAVRSRGTAKSIVGYSATVDGVVSDQLRAISEKNVPDAFGCKDANANPTKIPSKLGSAEGVPVRQPGKGQGQL
jgi:hypothetical protein